VAGGGDEVPIGQDGRPLDRPPQLENSALKLRRSHTR
jgi:hypothetical protein